MDRRTFFTNTFLGSASLAFGRMMPAAPGKFSRPLPPIKLHGLPERTTSKLAMPGLFPGRVVEVFHPDAIAQYHVSQPVIHKMLERGMLELTGENSIEAAWSKFIAPTDIVGLKINPSGTPACFTSPELVREVIQALESIGVPKHNIVVYDRIGYQVAVTGYGRLLPAGVRVVGVENRYDHSGHNVAGYDLNVYWEGTLFSEPQPRSYMASVVSQEVNKIINLPTLKDHSAAGVTGCLKNVSYGSFNNVGRTHVPPYTFTNPLIGMMCSMEPVRSKVVLNIMDGTKMVWHGGPLTQVRDFISEAKTLYLGSDPVAIDTIELEAIDKKRHEEGAPSIWDRSEDSITKDQQEFYHDPSKNLFYRQPGHIAAAGKLGLGQADLKKIDHVQIRLG
jgi:uncharacterized protein (DUF362 family)